MPDGPWHAAVPVLAAAAGVTRRVRIGTLVATPNFRHPVTLARDALALDDLSEGRFDLGVGPGSAGPDATALGQADGASNERMDRFEEFLADPAADTRRRRRPPARTITGRHYAAAETPSTPGAVQTPFPLTVAAGGRRGLAPGRRLRPAVGDHRPHRSGARDAGGDPGGRSAQTCVCSTAPARRKAGPADDAQGAAVDADRDGHHLHGPVRRTRGARMSELGFDQFVLHHPRRPGPTGGSLAAFEEIAARHGASERPLSGQRRSATSAASSAVRSTRIHPFDDDVVTPHPRRRRRPAPPPRWRAASCRVQRDLLGHQGVTLTAGIDQADELGAAQHRHGEVPVRGACGAARRPPADAGSRRAVRCGPCPRSTSRTARPARLRARHLRAKHVGGAGGDERRPLPSPATVTGSRSVSPRTRCTSSAGKPL